MTEDIADHADRFDDKAATYDEDKSPEYRRAVDLVIRHAAVERSDTVLDLGAGTGALTLALAPDAAEVIGRDISDGMLQRAREKAAERGIENATFGNGRFREPNVPADAEIDVVVSNFAMHHLADEEKREAIDVIAGLEPERFVLGDVMLFGEPAPDEPFYSPEVDDPATVGVLADAFTDAGFSLTAVEAVHDQVGVLVGERSALPDRTEGGA